LKIYPTLGSIVIFIFIILLL